MNTSWVLNFLLFVSLALNIWLGAAFLGREVPMNRFAEYNKSASNALPRDTQHAEHNALHERSNATHQRAPSRAHAEKRAPHQRMTFHRLKSLPQEYRDPALEVFRAQEPKLRTHAQKLRQARQEAYAYLAAPQFSREEAERRFTKMRILALSTLKQTQDMLLDIAETLPQEERQHLIPGGRAPEAPGRRPREGENRSPTVSEDE